MISDTSIQAWKITQEKLGYAQKQVLAAIRQYPNSTLTEIAGILDWTVNRVSGRITELKKPDPKHGRPVALIEDGGKRKCRITGNTAHIWREKFPIEMPPAFETKVEQTNQLFQ